MIKKTSAFLLSFLVLSMTAFSLYAGEKFIIDEKHSYVQWHIKHMGFSTQSGKWYAKGYLILDKDKPENSKVDVQIELSKLVTGIPELDNHLKGQQFFDVEKFPVATFVSDKVTVTGKNKGKVAGMLSFHGMSKPIVLDVVFNKSGKNPINDKLTAGFTATAKLKRSDFGMTTLLPDLGDEVDLNIEVEAYQDVAKDSKS